MPSPGGRLRVLGESTCTPAATELAGQRSAAMAGVAAVSLAAALGLPASHRPRHLADGLPPPCVGHQTLENSSSSILIRANEELCSYLVHVPRSLAPSGLTLWYTSDEACPDETDLHIRTYDGPTWMAALVRRHPRLPAPSSLASLTRPL